MRFSATLLGLVLSYSAFVNAETITPTLYSTSAINGTELKCTADKIIPLIKPDGSKIIDLCRNERQLCMFEGACIVKTTDGLIGINYVKFDENLEKSVFATFDMKTCPFGLGYTGACLDPYFSISADLKEYKIGDVLYIEKFKGTKLPTGETHDGYVIVRDSSTYHMGAGAEFVTIFTGFENDLNEKNPFMKMGFSDELINIESVRITDQATIKKVHEKRNFPNVPENLLNIISDK